MRYYLDCEFIDDGATIEPISLGVPNAAMAELLRAFIGDDEPEFWSWCSAYDWVMICQLYGTMMDKPEGWPSYCRDLQQELDRHGFTDDQLPAQAGDAHDALADARWHRNIHDWLTSRTAG